MYFRIFPDTLYPNVFPSVWIRLKWELLVCWCLLRSANGQLSDWDSDTDIRCGAHGPVARESVGVLFCDKRRLPTPGSEHDISVHLPTVTITDTMNWKQDIIVIMHPVANCLPSMIVGFRPSLQLETNVHHHHSLRLRPWGWLHLMVNISSNENKWVNDIQGPSLRLCCFHLDLCFMRPVRY